MVTLNAVSVVVVSNNVVSSIKTYKHAIHAEKEFKRAVEQDCTSRMTKHDMEEYLSDGFYETESVSGSICICHA